MPPTEQPAGPTGRARRRPNPRLILVALLAVVLASVGWNAWSRNRALHAPPAGSGTVEAVEVEVSPQVAGRIAEMPLEEGDAVRKGQFVARVDDREYRQALSQAEGAMQTARSNLRNLQDGARKEQIAAARAQLQAADSARAGAEQALVNADLAFQSVAELRQNVIAAEAQVRSLTAQLAAARQSAAAVDAQAAGARDSLTTAESGLESVTELQQARDAAEGARDAARASRERAESAAQVARADFKRVTELYEQGALSRREFDNAKLGLDSAQTALDAARAQALAADAGLRNAERALQQRLAARQSVISARTSTQSLARQRDGARDTVQQVSAQLEGARRALANARNAYADRVTARTQRDGARAQVRTSRAQVEAAKQNLGLLTAGNTPAVIDAARGQLRTAEATVRLARKRLSDTVVLAPRNGAVSTVVLRAGETVSAGLPIVRLLDLDNLWVRVYMPFAQFGKAKRGDAVSVTTDALPGETFQGRVLQVATEAEFTPKNVETRDQRLQQVYWIKVGIRNPDGRLKPGMPARATWEPGGAAAK